MREQARENADDEKRLDAFAPQDEDDLSVHDILLRVEDGLFDDDRALGGVEILVEVFFGTQ